MLVYTKQIYFRNISSLIIHNFNQFLNNMNINVIVDTTGFMTVLCYTKMI